MVPGMQWSEALMTGTARLWGTCRRPGRASKAPALRQDSFLKSDNFFLGGKRGSRQSRRRPQVPWRLQSYEYL